MHVRAWQVGYRGLLPRGYLDGLRPEERARRYTFGETPAGRPRTFVALERGVICGFVTTGPSREGPGGRAGEVMALYVDPDYWRSGVGRLLIADARRRLVREGWSEAILWLLVGNERGWAFYHADGWAPDGSPAHGAYLGRERGGDPLPARAALTARLRSDRSPCP